MLEFFKSRRWAFTRRFVLIAIILIVGYRSYGDAILSQFRGPNPQRDIVLTRVEFRPELGQATPGWIIGFRNNSTRYTYDQIQLEATFTDDSGKVIETARLVVKQKLTPGYEQIIGSTDFKSRGGATQGSLKVIDAERVQ
jgi:hypothetical protein